MSDSKSNASVHPDAPSAPAPAAAAAAASLGIEKAIVADILSVDENDHEYKIAVDDIEESNPNPFSVCIGALAFPLTCAMSWFCLEPNQEAVITNCGSFTRHVRKPGCFFSNCFGRDIIYVNTRQIAIDLPKTKVLDARGSPLHVSAVLIFYFSNTIRAALAVQNRDAYVSNVATATMRKVVSKFPYETEDNSPSLRTHQSLVTKLLTEAAQHQLRAAGATCITFQLNEISYSNEIAGAMLKRQAAEALVAARKVLVSGCSDIALDTVDLLRRRGIEMSDEQTAKLVNNIIVVTASEGSTVSTVGVDMD
jgi:SPFH domain / Band 7 family